VQLFADGLFCSSIVTGKFVSVPRVPPAEFNNLERHAFVRVSMATYF
jgi:hypothetical protein